MARASIADVRAVIDTDLADGEITPYIDDAALEVSERVEAANAGYSEQRLKKLEKYLAAHLIRFLRERQEESYSLSNVDVSYSGAFGEGLLATSAGQVVLDTDTADVFGTSGTEDESGRFVTRSRYVRSVSAGSDHPEGAEHPRGS